MAHEISSTDNVVLHKQRAWHGLGIVVEDAPTPREALAIAGMDWTVEQWPLLAQLGAESMPVNSHQLNVRSDTRAQLGLVGTGYQPIQNSELAEFAEALAECGPSGVRDTVRIESAGSIRGGQKVWFLLKGESFSVRHADDVTTPYILCSNGHDGFTSLRCTPTTVRVVCSNTLHAVIPDESASAGMRRGKPKQAHFVARHTRNIKERVEEAKQALQLYGRAIAATRALAEELAAHGVNSIAVDAFFVEAYTRDYGAIPAAQAGLTPQGQRARERATKAYRIFKDRFEDEEGTFGANRWTLFNAWSGYIQHDNGSRLKDAAKRVEAQLQSNLFGSNADRTLAAFGSVLAL